MLSMSATTSSFCVAGREKVLQVSRISTALAWMFCCLACQSPTRSDPRIPPAVGPPSRLLLQPCRYEHVLARCPVAAVWGDLYRNEREVSREALWSSSAPNIVRVISPGVLQAVAPGAADVEVAFNNVKMTARFRVLDEGPPWYVRVSGESHIRVLDENGQDLEGVLVEIIAGGNAGLQAISNRYGRAIFTAEFMCGPITARGTKQGYREWVGSAISCGRGGNGLWGSETVGPVRMITVR